MVTSGDSKRMALYLISLSPGIHKWLDNSSVALTLWGIRPSSCWPRVMFTEVAAIALRLPGHTKAVPSSFFEREATGCYCS
jgi:hypothetical protein